MTRDQLITFKLEKITQGGRASTKDLVSFIASLMDDPSTVLSGIKAEMADELTLRLARQADYKTKLQADIASLASVDIAQLSQISQK